MTIQNRYDFVLLFDVKDGNPNGDPDAGNLPRLDPETGKGLVTDVCLKRKIRNYVATKHKYDRPHDIYVKEGAVLGRTHVSVFKDLQIELEDIPRPVPKDLIEALEKLELPDGLDLLPSDEEDNRTMQVSGSLDKSEVRQWMKDTELEKKVEQFLKGTLKEVNTRKPTREETERGRKKMCEIFYDIRTFGAVLTLKSAPNCGQVRGPVQMTFARSVDQVVALEHSITRMAVATEAEAIKQSGANRTMGRKHTVPYGLYRAHGFVSSHLAAQTGFSSDDLELLWEALTNMFEHDRSAARGEMTTRGLYIFKHDSELGNAHAHRLFDLIQIGRANGNDDPPRSVHNYSIQTPDEGPVRDFPGITFIKKVG
ncbi:MAG: type I-C CRISPR-associated protein Cas7/Csd2 [Nitrospira sp.]|nr:type I-C CRISPR-associated protein Cas7/Csd2 [Nitrospira sp.]